MFQGLMVLCSIYYSMLLTNWGNPTLGGEQNSFFETSYKSFWIQMSCLWVSQAVYIFSLTAPLCFPDRDFN